MSESEKDYSVSSNSWLFPSTSESPLEISPRRSKSSEAETEQWVDPWTDPTYLCSPWEDATDTCSESAASNGTNEFRKYWRRRHSTGKLNRSFSRLEAGEEFRDVNVMQRGISTKSSRLDFGNKLGPTNWGLYKSKQEKWKSESTLDSPLETTYQDNFRWPQERFPLPVQLDQKQITEGQETVQELKDNKLTDKDWNLRGDPTQMLPIAWAPPEPRWPNELTNTAVAKPESDRLRETKARQKMTFEVQHPVEKWAANLYLD